MKLSVINVPEQTKKNRKYQIKYRKKKTFDAISNINDVECCFHRHLSSFGCGFCPVKFTEVCGESMPGRTELKML